jgi:AcrR family transcriptional regulator
LDLDQLLRWCGVSHVSEARVGPKRSLLAQGRSRDTRQAIIKAALELWSERGYDTGIDDTTAEEIAARAGVAKATFYFHFARKDDILLETGWLTARVFYEDALKALINAGSADEVIDGVTVKLCRRIERVPRLALRRMLRAQSAAAPDTPHTWNDPEHFGFRRGFAVIFLHAQQSGDLPQTVAPDNLGAMFEAQLMSAIQDWAHEEEASLLATLRERFAVLLAGARHVADDALAQARRARRARGGRRPVPARREVIRESHTESESAP